MKEKLIVEEVIFGAKTVRILEYDANVMLLFGGDSMANTGGLIG